VVVFVAVAGDVDDDGSIILVLGCDYDCSNVDSFLYLLKRQKEVVFTIIAD
jgi:hypothetical protein